MPWFPDFVSAVELARSQTRAAGQADPVGEYVIALNQGDTRALESAWPLEVVIHDPRVGEVRGHRQLRKFLRESKSLLAERHTRTETIASTLVGNRAVVELMAHLTGVDDEEVAWPVAVVAEAPDDRSVIFRSYFSRWPVSGNHYVRPPILEPNDAYLADVVGRFHVALDAGDTASIVGTFAAMGYLREPTGPAHSHRGIDELRTFFDECFRAGGGIHLEHCAVTDDGVRCALEYNCTRWGSHDLAPQAGLGVYERNAQGLLAAVRIYDDVEAPVEKS
jgi:limonene-1,2-epoxide hydrolase